MVTIVGPSNAAYTASRLVLVELCDPGLVQRAADADPELSRHLNKARAARLIKIVVNEPLVASAGLEEAPAQARSPGWSPT